MWTDQDDQDFDKHFGELATLPREHTTVSLSRRTHEKILEDLEHYKLLAEKRQQTIRRLIWTCAGLMVGYIAIVLNRIW